MRGLINTLAQSQGDSEQTTKTLSGVELDEVSKVFNDGVRHELPWELLLVGLGTTIIVIVMISLKRWWKARRQDPSPAVLYSAIARKAGLTWKDRVLLWRIARVFKLPTPIALLLARGTLRHYADMYLSSRSGPSRQRIDERIARIAAGLFG